MPQTRLVQWINRASYEDLLRRWRFSPPGDEIFQGDVGVYYIKAMKEKREAIGHEATINASKRVGWEK